MFSKLKNIFKKEEGQKEPKARKAKGPLLTPKEEATLNKQPWHDMQLITNPSDPRNGYFSGDWNEYHIQALQAAGYPGTTEDEIITAWLKEICYTVAKGDEELVDALARPKVQSQRNDDGTVEYS